MGRKKEIQELDEIIAITAFVQSHEIDGDKDLSTIVAKAIQDAGYRKADEVRKETAREIIAKLTDDLSGIEYPPERQLIKSYIEMFKEQYGVKVGE